MSEPSESSDKPSTAPASNTAPYRRSLRNYLLNSRYQLKFTLTMVSISLVLTAGLGYIVMLKTSEASRSAEMTMRALGDEEIYQQLVANNQTGDRLMIFALVGFALLLSIILSIYGIVITHKVAGPLHKVSNYLDRIRDGKLGVVYNLRKGDELVDFFEHFKAAHDALRAGYMDDIVLLEKIEKKLASLGAGANDDSVQALVEELQRARKRKADSLNPA